MQNDPTAAIEHWPELAFADWQDTATTLHMWTQIVGKVRLAQSPWLNHSWHVTLYVSPRGLSTGTIPHGRSSFSMEFDFLSHELRIETFYPTDDATRTFFEQAA